MCKLIEDFIKSANSIDGVGYWKGDLGALRYSRYLTRLQKRKWRRYGIVPAAVFWFLESIKAIQRVSHVPERQRTLTFLLDVLWETLQRNGPSASEGEVLRVELLKELGLLPKNARASAQHVYVKGQLYNSVLARRRSGS
jgi:hypothetical protein